MAKYVCTLLLLGLAAQKQRSPEALEGQRSPEALEGQPSPEALDGQRKA